MSINNRPRTAKRILRLRAALVKEKLLRAEADDRASWQASEARKSAYLASLVQQEVMNLRMRLAQINQLSSVVLRRTDPVPGE